MIGDELWTSWSEAGLVVLSAVAVLLAVIVVIRINGLRSLSKMSSFDFAVTVAIGSVIASVAATSTSLADGVLAVAALLATQWLIATLRRRSSLSALVDNSPMLLVRNGEFCDEALDATRVTRSDILAKYREANVTDRSQVLAVVLESTGDISVLHGEGPLDMGLFDGVRNCDWEAH